MGRPKGSKNHKRKYTRRKRSLTSIARNASGEQIAQATDAALLVDEIKQMLIGAEPLVARVAITRLLSDLLLVAKIIEGAPPAP